MDGLKHSLVALFALAGLAMAAIAAGPWHGGHGKHYNPSPHPRPADRHWRTAALSALLIGHTAPTTPPTMAITSAEVHCITATARTSPRMAPGAGTISEDTSTAASIWAGGMAGDIKAAAENTRPMGRRSCTTSRGSGVDFPSIIFEFDGSDRPITSSSQTSETGTSAAGLFRGLRSNPSRGHNRRFAPWSTPRG